MTIMMSASPLVMYSRLNHVRLEGRTTAAVAPMTSQSGNRFAAPWGHTAQLMLKGGGPADSGLCMHIACDYFSCRCC